VTVACIFNMNNNFFALTRYLRDRGIDAHLVLLNNEVPHFHPSCDSYTLEYQAYTKTLNWGSPATFGKAMAPTIERDLKEYDFVIGCANVPAFMSLIDRQLDVFTPFGGDLYHAPFFEFHDMRSLIISLQRWSWTKNQAQGIRRSRYINTDDGLDIAKKSLQRLRISGEVLNFGVPMLYTPAYDPDSIEANYDRSQWYQEIKSIREKNDLVVFHHARHLWTSSPDSISWKRNDKLIKGFAAFVRKSKGDVKPCLIMCEYGPDVGASKKLIAELGIETQVRWFPPMSRKDIMIGIHLSDIGCGDFQIGSLLGGVNYEVLATGKPFMHYRDDDLYKNLSHELYPLMNVNTPDEMTHALCDYMARPDYYKEMGIQGRQWLQKYAIDYPVDEYVKLIQSSS